MDQHTFRTTKENEYMLFGVRLKVLLTAGQTGKQFSLVEGVMPPGADSGLHVHHREDESMHIVEGFLEVTIGSKKRLLVPGDSYFAPRGVPHRLRNVGEIPTRSYMIATPGDFASFVMEAGEPISADDAHQPIAGPTPSQMERIMELMSKWGIEMIVPPGSP